MRRLAVDMASNRDRRAYDVRWVVQAQQPAQWDPWGSVSVLTPSPWWSCCCGGRRAAGHDCSRACAPPARQQDQLRGHDPLTGLMTRPEFELMLDEAALACDHGPGRWRAVYRAGQLQAAERGLRPPGGRRPAGGERRAARTRRRASRQSPRAWAATNLPAGRRRRGGRRACRRAVAAVAATALSASTSWSCRSAASVGIAVYPDHGSRPRLLAHAALAMRTVKLGGGAGHAFSTPAMGVNLREQAECCRTCAALSSVASSSSTTSPRSTQAACRSPLPRRCCAGSTRGAA